MSILSNNFYYQPLKIDSVNTQMYGDFIAKEGDANGRGLLVTLTENGLLKDTTGITLNLKWAHTTVAGVQGLDPFESIDLTKGLYKVTYPTNMLRKGKVDAFIQIIDSGSVIGSRNIKINVEATVGDDAAIESSNVFTALASALVEVQSWNARIDDVEQEFIDKANNLDATYPIELNSVKSQLAEAENTLQGIDRTFGDTTFATLIDLQTTYPTGDTKRYIIAADGKWYWWNGTAWTAGQVAQAIGIADRGVNPVKLDRFYKRQETAQVTGVSFALADIDTDNICFVDAVADRNVFSHGKNLQAFDILSIDGTLLNQVVTDEDVTVTIVAGASYKQVKLQPVYLKAGTYAFHRDFEILSGTGTGNVGFTYIYKCSEIGVNEGSAVTSIGITAQTASYTVPTDGWYIFNLYANLNGTVTADITIRFYNVQIEKLAYTFYEKFLGAKQKGMALAFDTFVGMNLYADGEILVTYPVRDATDEAGIIDVVCDGDSLTNGTGSTTLKPVSDTNTDVSYPAVLGRKLGSGYNVINAGVGGETSWMVAARQGGMPVQILPVTIPATTTAERVYLYGQEQDYYYDGTSWTYDKDNLSYNIATEGNARVNPCYIGGIEGTLTRTLLSAGTPDPETGETVQSATYAYYFTRTVAGAETDLTTPTDLITYASKNYRDAIHIFWVGQNDAPLHDGVYRTQIGMEKRIQNMVDILNHDKYIVMNYPSGDNTNTAQEFTQQFGNHFLNIRKYLSTYGIAIANEMGANITPTQADIDAMAAGSIPPSLRIDGVHGNYWYYQVAAKRALYEKGQTLGYWS